jgi:hypothetical protein
MFSQPKKQEHTCELVADRFTAHAAAADTNGVVDDASASSRRAKASDAA